MVECDEVGKDQEKGREGKSHRENVRERTKQEHIVKDHPKMSTKLSFLFISLSTIDCTQ